MHDAEQWDRTVRELERQYPGKFLPKDEIFARIKRGSRIFIGTGCGQPGYLLQAMIDYAEANPKALFDTEMYVVLVFGLEQYRYEKLERYFRQQCFSIRENMRGTVNRGYGDYNAVFLSRVPGLFRRGLIPLDLAVIQVSLPDDRGRVSLGISVDVTRAAVEHAPLVIAQMNPQMPYVGGDALIPLEELDCIVPYAEPLFEFHYRPLDEIDSKIGRYAASLIEDGSTLQAGHGSTARAVLPFLESRSHLGIHSELLNDDLVRLIRSGAVDNTRKGFDTGRTVATICLGSRDTYEFLHNNDSVELRGVDYTNNPVVIARHDNMVALNGILSIDLTGQATAESIGRTFYSGLGGIADFARGASLASEGKSIVVLRSTDRSGKISRIVPFLKEGEGVTLGRGDMQYVVTEYGIAALTGKNIRERAMDLIGIAHPDFRPWLIEEARQNNLIYRDQVFIAGEGGRYPEDLERRAVTSSGEEVFLRPVKFSDERLLKEFKYSLSLESLYNRFVSHKEMPHEILQKLVVIDYLKEMAIFAVRRQEEREVILGVGRYFIEDGHFANFAVAVRDDCQKQGIGTLLLSRLIEVAREKGLSGFTVDVLLENKSMIALLNHFRKEGHRLDKSIEGDMGLYILHFGEIVQG